MPASSPGPGEQQVGEYLAACAAHAGLDVDFQPVRTGRANVIITLRPSGTPSRRILLAPHLDTVPAATPEQLTPRLHQKRIYGRGACDTKGSVAAMFTALLALAQAPRRPKVTEIVLAGLVDEEVNQTGSRTLAASSFKADLAIVGEPTRCRVITAHKGDLWLQLHTEGKAAHGACPELGQNAIHEMAKVVCLLETQYAEALRARPHPLLGPPTINVGLIRGGTQPNIVPDRCRITIDRRLVPGENEKQVLREIAAMLRPHGLRAIVSDQKGVPCLPLETDANLPLVQQFMRVAGNREPAGVHYFCDAAILSAGGIPSVVFGPGNIAQAHTSDEWVAVAELEKAAAILTKFLAEQP
jgi:acetylornithine deacetylase/succinyl-diaminopimelate desuccinylase-like protein